MKYNFAINITVIAIVAVICFVEAFSDWREVMKIMHNGLEIVSSFDCNASIQVAHNRVSNDEGGTTAAIKINEYDDFTVAVLNKQELTQLRDHLNELLEEKGQC